MHTNHYSSRHCQHSSSFLCGEIRYSSLGTFLVPCPVLSPFLLKERSLSSLLPLLPHIFFQQKFFVCKLLVVNWPGHTQYGNVLDNGMIFFLFDIFTEPKSDDTFSGTLTFQVFICRAFPAIVRLKQSKSLPGIFDQFVHLGRTLSLTFQPQQQPEKKNQAAGIHFIKWSFL